MQQINLSFLRTFGCVLLLLLLSLSTQAQHSTYLPSPVKQLTFRPHPTQPHLMIGTDSLNNTWIKGSIPSEKLNENLTFQIQNPTIFDYNLYIETDSFFSMLHPNLDSQKNTIRSRFAQYNFNTSHPIFYLNLGDKSAANIPIILEEQTQFAVTESFHLLRIGLYYGIAVMSIIFNFVFYVVFKDKRFLTYSLLQISIFTILFFEDGMFYYTLSGQCDMSPILTWIIPITAVLACLFTLYFLDMRRFFHTYRFIFISLFIVLFVLASIQTFLQVEVLKHVLNIVSFIPPLFSLVLAATQFKTNVYARFLLCTVGLIVLFSLTYACYTYLNQYPFTWFSLDAFRLISNIEIISITFAIIYKIRDLQEENIDFKNQINQYLILLEKNTDSSAKLYNYRLIELLENLKISHNLTTRETEVLHCIWEGMSNQDISTKLFISLSTTKYHIGNLYTKLEINNRNQALRFKKK